MPRHLLGLDGLDRATLTGLVRRAGELAGDWARRAMPAALAGRRVAVVVDDGGWRNTTAFELGIAAMGGTSVRAPVTLGGKEAPEDLAAYLGNWVDAVVIRTPDIELLRRFAAASAVPVINARTRWNHPCETLGDLAFLASIGKAAEGLRVAAIAPAANILRSWAEVAEVAGLSVVQVHPGHAIEAWPGVSVSEDIAAIDGADVMVTDCWPAGADAAALAPYRVTPALLERLAPGAVFLPCPPVTRGEEVSAEAMTHPACRVVEAKAWLLHAQNAVLEWALAGDGFPFGARDPT